MGFTTFEGKQAEGELADERKIPSIACTSGKSIRESLPDKNEGRVIAVERRHFPIRKDVQGKEKKEKGRHRHQYGPTCIASGKIAMSRIREGPSTPAHIPHKKGRGGMNTGGRRKNNRLKLSPHGYGFCNDLVRWRKRDRLAQRRRGEKAGRLQEGRKKGRDATRRCDPRDFPQLPSRGERRGSIIVL